MSEIEKSEGRFTYGEAGGGRGIIVCVELSLSGLFFSGSDLISIVVGVDLG